MKKVISLITFFLAFIIAACAVCLAGCSSSSESDVYLHLIDFDKCDIGYEIPVYPSDEFDYVVSDDCTVHIDSMSAFLANKLDSSIIYDYYQPYTVQVDIHGTTDMGLSGCELKAYAFPYPSSVFYGGTSIITELGEISWTITFTCMSIVAVYFYEITM